MKIIDKMVIRSFVGPYVLSFFIAEFVLVMQFLWKYIDDILGKGFPIKYIIELVFYYGVTIVPTALPVSILIASVMVFGDMSEKHEIASLKSAGLPLTRIMKGGIWITIFTFLLSLFASNYLKPKAAFQFRKRFEAIYRSQSTLAIEEKIFNDDFENFVIRIGSKKSGSNKMYDVLIYDHTKPNKSLVNVISCDSAEMYVTPDGKNFVMELYSGIQYQEENSEKNEDGSTKYPFMKTSFSKFKKVMDMSAFLSVGDQFDIGQRREDVLNSLQLSQAIDSMRIDKSGTYEQLKFDYNGLTRNLASIKPEDIALFVSNNIAITDTIKSNNKSLSPPVNYAGVDQYLEQKIMQSQHQREKTKKGKIQDTTVLTVKQRANPLTSTVPYKSMHEVIDSNEYFIVLGKSIGLASARSDIAYAAAAAAQGVQFNIEKYRLRFHQHFSNALMCVVFFFIGAPLGSIIRKGGYGYPLLIAIVFYMIYMISLIVGEKLIRNDTVDGISGGWLPVGLLLPFAILFTIQALNDIKFDINSNFVALASKLKKNGA